MSRFARLSPNAQGILLTIGAIFFFTLMDATAKGLTARYDTLQVVWARYTGQTVIVLALLAPRLRAVARTRYPGMQFLRSCFQFGATVCFFLSLAHIGLAEATAVMDLNPVLITLGAAVFLGERIGLRRALGIAAALAGSMLIIRPGTEVFSVYALLPLGAAVFYAAYAISTRAVGRDESVWTSLLYTALVGTALTSVALPAVWVTPAAGDAAFFLLLGVFGGAAQLLLIRALAVAEAGVIAPFSYVGLLFAAIWGMAFFGEYPDRWTVTGALVIVAAGLYVWHRETRAVASARPGPGKDDAA